MLELGGKHWERNAGSGELDGGTLGTVVGVFAIKHVLDCRFALLGGTNFGYLDVLILGKSTCLENALGSLHVYASAQNMNVLFSVHLNGNFFCWGLVMQVNPETKEREHGMQGHWPPTWGHGTHFWRFICPGSVQLSQCSARWPICLPSHLYMPAIGLTELLRWKPRRMDVAVCWTLSEKKAVNTLCFVICIYGNPTLVWLAGCFDIRFRDGGCWCEFYVYCHFALDIENNATCDIFSFDTPL